ncbi:unnamed protein product [Thelazia callipaeda]|uniref:UNC80 domain-containing protein n=1 Tax=Thelazia callipaeda TaxID=103827 RepID=A0A158RCD7_THECL|nr:unnamed protein product [Thelazia callipaeda]
MIAPLLNVITEKDFTSNYRLESGLKIWQCLWQASYIKFLANSFSGLHRQPDVLCFCAPVKQRRSHFPIITITKKSEPTSVIQGIYLGGENEAQTRRFSTVPAQNAKFPPLIDAPPPKPPRTDLAVLSSLRKRKEREKAAALASLSVDACDQKKQQQEEKFQEVSLELFIFIFKLQAANTLPDKIGLVVRSVSEYRSDEDASNIRGLFKKSRAMTFTDKSPSLCKGIPELDDVLHFADDKSLSYAMQEISEKAPLVFLQEICSGTSGDLESVPQTGSHVTEFPKFRYKRDSLSSRVTLIPSREISSSMNSSVAEINAEGAVCTQNNEKVMGKMKKKVNLVAKETSNVFDPLENIPYQSSTMQQPRGDPQEATYLDVAVIRCLLIKHWAEEGIFWAMKYLLHRLLEIKIHRNAQNDLFRSRSKSVPNLQHLKLFPSEVNNHRNLQEIHHQLSTWEDLQLKNVARKLENIEVEKSGRLKFTSTQSMKNLSAKASLIVKSSSKQSIMATSVSFVKSRDKRGHLERNRSDPSLTNSSEVLSVRDGRSCSISALPGQAANKHSTRHFFPEFQALGCTNFIERNGQISFIVLLKAINLIVEERLSVRICELALNACEIFLDMPGTEFQTFMDNSINIVLRSQKHFIVKIYLWLGCPLGCNDGLRTRQGDFLRVKARTILAIIHQFDPQIFAQLLVGHIEEYGPQALMDTLHSLTGFCKCDITAFIAGMYRSRSTSSPRRQTVKSEHSVPAYHNNFNENLKGIEGIVIKVILKPVISKLMKTMHELVQPENMSLYQDVRLFVTFIQEQHGNPFRRVGLSALLDGWPADDQFQLSSTLDVSVPNFAYLIDLSEEKSSRRASYLYPLPEIFLTERSAKYASNDDNE